MNESDFIWLGTLIPAQSRSLDGSDEVVGDLQVVLAVVPVEGDPRHLILVQHSQLAVDGLSQLHELWLVVLGLLHLGLSFFLGGVRALGFGGG